MSVKIRIYHKFEEWYCHLPKIQQAQVDARLSLIKNYGHFGHVKHIEAKLFEIKFKNGIRIYFFRSAEKEITLILGGTKHGQQKDIQKAKKILDI